MNPAGVTGMPARALVRDRVQRYSLQSHAGVRAENDGGLGTGFVAVPPPTDNPLNTLGFGGFWPTLHPFRAFNPTIRPSTGATRACSLEGGYGASAGMAQTVGDYECGYSTLHLQFRTDPLEVERVITPGASGWAATGSSPGASFSSAAGAPSTGSRASSSAASGASPTGGAAPPARPSWAAAWISAASAASASKA